MTAEVKVQTHPTAQVTGDPQLGEGTTIGPFCVLDGSGGLVIGRGCELGAGAQVHTCSSVRQRVTDGVAPVERQPVRIGDCTVVGPGAVVLMGVSIGSHCVVGAGAVVTRDLPDRAVAVGVPAMVIGHVDLDTGETVPLQPPF